LSAQWHIAICTLDDWTRRPCMALRKAKPAAVVNERTGT